MNSSLGSSTLNGLQRQKASSYREDQLKRPEIRIERPSETNRSKMNGRKSSKQRPAEQANGSLLSPAAKTSSLSKSDQMLNRLLRDQLELAYIDHQKNLKNAQSHAALQLLRRSQPRLEVSPTNSRNSSPGRTHPALTACRSHSPLSHKNSDGGWSSGSDHSHNSYRSTPHIIQTANAKYQHLTKSKPFPTQSQTAPCSPVHRVQDRSNYRSQADEHSQLQKKAHANLLWNYIYDAVNSGHLENFDEKDPKKWWQKLFLMLKYKHGKGMCYGLISLLYCSKPEAAGPDGDAGDQAANGKIWLLI